MKKKILALCDQEADYVQHMTEYLKTRKELPFEIYGYTEPEKLVDFGKAHEIQMLVVAENAYTLQVSRVLAGQTIILKETNQKLLEELPQISKYQRAENVYQFIMERYLEQISMTEAWKESKGQAVIIGLYSPIRRCLQTSFALTLGQLLAERYSTLYISFEHYCGWNRLLKKEGGKDLSDLLCHIDEAEEKFCHRIWIAEQKIGNLGYIPPFYTGQNLIYITAQEWRKLLDKIARTGGYQYIILDLSESLQGVFDMLRMCRRIYTIVREDEPARSKVEQYEQLLRWYEFEDVLEKTRKEILPTFQELPSRLEQFTKGELGSLVKKIIKEDLEVQNVDL
ncbi:MAG: hypothetical protein E7293_08460 [Lachnospiraceae bacterium]|nr:hypothetical protein [Lachnospiraceae bacterium]